MTVWDRCYKQSDVFFSRKIVRIVSKTNQNFQCLRNTQCKFNTRCILSKSEQGSEDFIGRYWSSTQETWMAYAEDVFRKFWAQEVNTVPVFVVDNGPHCTSPYYIILYREEESIVPMTTDQMTVQHRIGESNPLCKKWCNTGLTDAMISIIRCIWLSGEKKRF